MLRLNDTVLEGTINIQGANTYVEVEITQPKDYIYLLSVYGKEDKVLAVVELKHVKENIYACNIPLLEEFVHEQISTNIVLSDGISSMITNTVTVKISKEKLKSLVANAEKVQIDSIVRELAEQRALINKYFSRLIPTQMPEFDKSVIQKGMVPTCIDSEGHIAFSFPFADSLTEVNGKKSVSRRITLGPQDIEFREGTVESALNNILKAIDKINNNVKQLAEIINSHADRLGQVELALTDFLNC